MGQPSEFCIILYNNILDHAFPTLWQQFLERLFLYQYDNAQMHKPSFIKKMVFCPDLNPVPHIWDELECRLWSYCPKSVTDLTNAHAAEWEQITAAKFLKSCGKPSQRGKVAY